MLKLIDGYYDEDSNWFAAGDSAHSLFSDVAIDDNPPFEYVEIHDTENRRLLPEDYRNLLIAHFVKQT